MTQLTAYDPEVNARMRAIVLQAINAQPGSNYITIRKWIETNKHFTMENVGARVRELARLEKPPLAKILYDEEGHVFCFPTNFFDEKEK